MPPQAAAAGPCDTLHDPLGSPEVDARCFGGSVDRCTVTVQREHRDHGLDWLCGDTGRNQLRRKVCFDLCNFCIEL
jgi:hypothetical protein